MTANSTKIHPVYIHADCLPTKFRAMTMRFLDRRIFTVTNKASIALTTGRGPANLILFHRCATFWTCHHSNILPNLTHHFSHSRTCSLLTIENGGDKIQPAQRAFERQTPPSSSGPGRGPLKAKTGVRVPLGAHI